MGLAVGLGDGPTRTLDEVLAHFGESDGETLSLRLLRDAMERQDADDVEMALIVHAAADASVEKFLEPLIELFPADWHREYEDIVRMLGHLRSPRTVPTLALATHWVPKYLHWDENRALAVKAIWALGAIPGAEGLHLARTPPVATARPRMPNVLPGSLRAREDTAARPKAHHTRSRHRDRCTNGWQRGHRLLLRVAIPWLTKRTTPRVARPTPA